MVNYETFELRGALAGLDFRVERPADWVVVPLPEQKHDFDDPQQFAPIALLMAPYAAVVFAVAVRPAYAEGAVAQWLAWHAKERNLDPSPMERQRLGAIDAVGGWGVQIEDGTAMRVRLVMCEDGQRVLQINCMAPDALWPSAAATFERMLATFALVAPKGATAPLAAADAPLLDDTMRSPAPARTEAAPGPLAMPRAEPAAAEAIALAADQATFEPEHPLNVSMRDNGAGLVPDVLDYHDQERWATLAPAALRATLRVPFGWHVVDDGRRTLVFDAAGHTQVSLQLMRRDGRSDDEILDAKVPELQREWPRMRHQRSVFAGLPCLLVRDAVVGGQAIEQAHVLRDAPDDLVLHVSVTSTPSRFRSAGDLAEVLLRDLRFAEATA